MCNKPIAELNNRALARHGNEAITQKHYFFCFLYPNVERQLLGLKAGFDRFLKLSNIFSLGEVNCYNSSHLIRSDSEIAKSTK